MNSWSADIWWWKPFAHISQSTFLNGLIRWFSLALLGFLLSLMLQTFLQTFIHKYHNRRITFFHTGHTSRRYLDFALATAVDMKSNPLAQISHLKFPFGYCISLSSCLMILFLVLTYHSNQWWYRQLVCTWITNITLSLQFGHAQARAVVILYIVFAQISHSIST